MLSVISSIPIALYLAALALGLIGIPLPFADAALSSLAQWMLVLSLGLQSLWAAFCHAFMTERVAHSIGWQPSPFQHEIAGANLGIGLSAVTAAVLGPPAAWAIFVMAASFLWSASATHIADMVRTRNFSINNAGPVFWWDILTPLTLLIALF